MTAMDDGPQGRTVLPIDRDPAALVSMRHAYGGRCPECGPDGCARWRWAQAAQAGQVVERHAAGQRCAGCGEGGCVRLVEAGVLVRAWLRDMLVAAGVRDHPLLVW